MSAIYYQIELCFLINRDPFFYHTLPTLIIEFVSGIDGFLVVLNVIYKVL